jgi:hypothetical protein
MAMTRPVPDCVRPIDPGKIRSKQGPDLKFLTLTPLIHPVPTRDPPWPVPRLLVTRLDPSRAYPYLSVFTRVYPN